MARVPEKVNQGNPSQGDPSAFPCFGNIGPTLIATLNLIELTIGLSVWLFSTLIVLNAHDAFK